jgi:hypothetical protein
MFGREAWICVHIGRISGRYPAVLNISKTGHLALMYLGSQSEETLLCICEVTLPSG